MSILESIADLFRPKIVVASRQAMNNGNYDFLCLFAEIGHPNGTRIVRWLAKRGRDCFFGQSSSVNEQPEMKLLEKCPEDVEVRYADPIIWQGKYISEGRDGVQYLIGMVTAKKCQWRQIWNPEADCKAVALARAVFDEIEPDPR